MASPVRRSSGARFLTTSTWRTPAGGPRQSHPAGAEAGLSAGGLRPSPQGFPSPEGDEQRRSLLRRTSHHCRGDQAVSGPSLGWRSLLIPGHMSTSLDRGRSDELCRTTGCLATDSTVRLCKVLDVPRSYTCRPVPRTPHAGSACDEAGAFSCRTPNDDALSCRAGPFQAGALAQFNVGADTVRGYH